LGMGGAGASGVAPGVASGDVGALGTVMFGAEGSPTRTFFAAAGANGPPADASSPDSVPSLHHQFPIAGGKSARSEASEIGDHAAFLVVRQVQVSHSIVSRGTRL